MQTQLRQQQQHQSGQLPRRRQHNQGQGQNSQGQAQHSDMEALLVGPAPLTASTLAAADAQMQKKMIGERLYPVWIQTNKYNSILLAADKIPPPSFQSLSPNLNLLSLVKSLACFLRWTTRSCCTYLSHQNPSMRKWASVALFQLFSFSYLSPSPLSDQWSPWSAQGLRVDAARMNIPFLPSSLPPS